MQTDNPFYVPKYYPELLKNLELDASAPEGSQEYTFRLMDFPAAQ